MNPKSLTGLGEPVPFGKKFLFQPPSEDLKASSSQPKDAEKRKQTAPPVSSETVIGETRMRMTLEITKKSLSILQEYQNRYRLETGRALPKWKIISEALGLYEQFKAGEGSEHSKPAADQ